MNKQMKALGFKQVTACTKPKISLRLNHHCRGGILLCFRLKTGVVLVDGLLKEDNISTDF